MTASPWPHFTLEEISCRCGCGKMGMNADFMEKIEKLRLFCGYPFVVTSAYRCPDHDAKVSQSSRPGHGPHTTGHAMDINVYGAQALDFIEKALKLGVFSGFGLAQKGSIRSRFAHLDDLTQAEAQVHRPNMWTY